MSIAVVLPVLSATSDGKAVGTLLSGIVRVELSERTDVALSEAVALGKRPTGISVAVVLSPVVKLPVMIAVGGCSVVVGVNESVMLAFVIYGLSVTLISLLVEVSVGRKLVFEAMVFSTMVVLDAETSALADDVGVESSGDGEDEVAFVYVV